MIRSASLAHSGWKFAWPGLEVLNSAGKPLSAATFNFNIFTAGGTVLLVAGILTAVYRLSVRRAFSSLVGVVVQFKWTILTVVAVLALAYVMNFSGQTVTLGLALAATGGFFAFLSPVVGWIGVAVTGSDTSANSLFGLLQTTAATQTGISPYLLAAANTSGGVLGKMISPQNLAIAAAVVGIEGRESELFRKVVVVESGPAAGHVRAGLPAVHPGPRLDGRRRVNSCRSAAQAGQSHPEQRRSAVKRTRSGQHDAARVPAGLLAALGAALGGPGQVRSRATDRLALGHDASHFALTPSAVATPVDAAEVGRLFAVSAAQGVPMTFRSGGTSLSGQGGDRRDPGGHPAAFPGHRDPRRRRPGADRPRRDGASGQRPARPARSQARPGSGERDRLHPRRCGGQQFQRDGLRHGREHLQHAGFAGAGAAQRHRDRHRRRRRRPTTAGPGTGSVPGAGPAAGPGQGKSRLGADHRAAVLDEEHHGLRAELAAGSHPAGGHPGAPGGRQRGHPGLRRIRCHAHRPAAASTR